MVIMDSTTTPARATPQPAGRDTKASPKAYVTGMRKATLQPNQIIVAQAFRGREGRVYGFHVKTLAKAMRNTRRVPPPLVWGEIGVDGQPTGRFILLDGLHRVRAWESLTAADPTARSRGIPVQVFTGTKAEARLKAAEPNTRDSLPWTERERMNYAWRTVMEFRRNLTMEAVANATSVSTRSVSAMRGILDAFEAAGKEPSGDWLRDHRTIKGEDVSSVFPDDMTEDALEAAAEAEAGRFFAVMKLRLPRDALILYRAIGKLLGPQGVRAFAEFQLGGAEELDEFLGQAVTASDLSDDTNF